MKLSTLLLMGIAVGVGFFLATEDKEGLINDIKDGVSKGKDFVTKKLGQTVDDISDNVSGRQG